MHALNLAGCGNRVAQHGVRDVSRAAPRNGIVHLSDGSTLYVSRAHRKIALVIGSLAAAGARSADVTLGLLAGAGASEGARAALAGAIACGSALFFFRKVCRLRAGDLARCVVFRCGRN